MEWIVVACVAGLATSIGVSTYMVRNNNSDRH
jgi:hypothetical protein